jgi:hypothetical protein
MLALASAAFQAGDPTAAAEHFHEGAGLTADPRLRAAYAAEWGYALQAAGRHEEAFAVRERAVEEVAGVDRDHVVPLDDVDPGVALEHLAAAAVDQRVPGLLADLARRLEDPQLPRQSVSASQTRRRWRLRSV